ncbi:MAG: hypothetical protein KDC98_05840, partial [Planctomycetes bacterium]|nr:hypothetical protein [Planctomycetota bacterium]
MRGRLRYLFALGFLALFALLPAPDATSGKPYVALLQVRAWLLGGSSPLAGWATADAVRPIDVSLRQSPPIEDAALYRARCTEFARIATEWAIAHRVVVDPELEPVPLELVIGEFGVRATMPDRDARPVRFEAMFPTRASL